MDRLAGISSWLADVRSFVLDQSPGLLPVLDAYAGEAQHGRSFIAADLARLVPGAHVLELGAGSLLLSCQLAREGFQVTALEPVGPGFSHFDRLRDLVLGFARSRGHAPTLLTMPAEQLDIRSQVDFAFSVNVMEHVVDVARVIERVSRSLKAGACYRFTCPNYLFPYEPHFNLFTLFSKALTARLRSRSIFQRPDMPDAVEVWRSLNWISVPMVAQAARAIAGIDAKFNRQMLVHTVERMASDAQFAARHTGVLRVVLLALLRFRLHRLFAMVPASLQPVMDCSIARRGAIGGA